MSKYENLRAESQSLLESNILPFWATRMVDTEHGGFYGRIWTPQKIVYCPVGFLSPHKNSKLSLSHATRCYGFPEEFEIDIDTFVPHVTPIYVKSS